MELNEYQRLSGFTAGKHLDSASHLAAGGLGIAGEAGEVADLIKKHLYHQHPLDDVKTAKELGDVLWYIQDIATAIGFSLEAIAAMNLSKLRARYPDGFSPEASLNRKE